MEEAALAEKAIADMCLAVEKDGWDGEWFLRAYDAYEQKIGSKECEEGQIFIEPQGFCVMAEIGKEKGLCQKSMESVEKLLDTKYGIVLLQPPYRRYHVELGEISSYPPDIKKTPVFSAITTPGFPLRRPLSAEGTEHGRCTPGHARPTSRISAKSTAQSLMCIPR